ncbi:MAG: methyltransferase family protein [Mycobacteriales bacterium]
MHVVETLFGVGWAAFWIYWFIAAVGVKRGRTSWGPEIGIRIVIVAIVVGLTRLHAFRHHDTNTSTWGYAVGLALFAGGLGFAIWARVHIGRNWGHPMSQKVDPELVTSGPYRLVRHPIYSGVILAGIGTAVALSWLWLVAVALAAIYFIYSATVEERFMTEQFPDDYPAYRSTSKMLVPFVL